MTADDERGGEGWLGSLVASLPELTEQDGEFRLMSRAWSGALHIGVTGGSRWTATIEPGRVVRVAPHVDGEAIGPKDVGVSAPLELWRDMLAAEPAPLASDPTAAVFRGFAWEGEREVVAQTNPAVRRVVELLRQAANPDRAWDTGIVPSSVPAGRWDRANGGYLHVRLGGADHRMYVEQSGDGIPLLLQHTAGADGRQWRHVLEDEGLCSQFRMIAYDLPYHGKSLPPTGERWWSEEYVLTKDALMAVPLALIDAMHLDRPVLMGSSIGGHLAVDLAYHHPNRFRAVIGLEAALKQTEGDLSLLWHPRVSNEYKAMLMYGLTAPSAPEAYRRETAWVYSQGAPPTFAGDLHYWQTDHDLRGKAEQIDTGLCEVSLLTGEYDWATTPSMSQELAASIRGATFQVMAGLGHFPMSEDPDRFLSYVRPILEGIASRSI
jgi:pimeloyl-ACP methyl ester carboxylesterase